MDYCAQAMSKASSTSYLVDVTPGANHSVVTEQMAEPRIVSSAIPSITICSGFIAFTQSRKVLYL